MKIFRVKPKDTEIINSLIDFLKNQYDVSVSPEHLETFVSDDRTYLFIAQLKENIMGYTISFRFPAFTEKGFLAYLYDIEVVENQRKKGIGRRLVEESLAELKKDGATELWLGTATNNTAGQALFTSTGGEKSGETFNDFIYDLTEKLIKPF